MPLSTLIWLTPASLLKGHFLREAFPDLPAIKSTLDFLSQSTITLVIFCLLIYSVKQIPRLYSSLMSPIAIEVSSTFTKTNIVWIMNKKQGRDVKVSCTSSMDTHKIPPSTENIGITPFSYRHHPPSEKTSQTIHSKLAGSPFHPLSVLSFLFLLFDVSL